MQNRRYCTVPAHQDGEHTAACIAPAEPGNPELRLVRSIFGLCPDCDQADEHEHVTGTGKKAGE